MSLKLINCHHIKKWRRRKEPTGFDSAQQPLPALNPLKPTATGGQEIIRLHRRPRTKLARLVSLLSLTCLVIASELWDAEQQQPHQIANRCAQFNNYNNNNNNNNINSTNKQVELTLSEASAAVRQFCLNYDNHLEDTKTVFRKGIKRPPFILFAQAIPDANRLYEDLMMTYNRIIRPVKNNTDRVVVKLSLKLSQLIEVNLKNQMMTTNVWLNQEWFDYKLKWDPSEYGGIEDINVPAEQIWLPDIVLYNSAEGYFAVSIMTKAKVHFDGHVIWNPPAIFRSSCQIDITFFPFDSQNCRLKFGSWTFGATIDLRHIHINDTENYIERGTDLSEYYQNVEWDIMVASARRNVITYACCPNDEYPDVTFDFTLRRKPLFYTVNLILPCVGITILSFLVFYLPSDSGEKVTLTISILVSLIFFLSVLIETIPSTSLAMPLLGKYLVFTMILITVSVCATVFVLNIHFRTPSTHSMPNWVKHWCIDVLPKYLFLNVPQYQSSQTNILPEQLIYSHNPAYANNNKWPTPAQLNPNQINHKLNSVQETSNAVMSMMMSRGSTKLAANSKQTSKESNAGSCGSKQPRQLNPNSLLLLEQELVGGKPGASSSSLFLPYLQSEAARRLQMQRSRSSERDTRNNSASENHQMSTLTAQHNQSTNNKLCDNNSTSPKETKVEMGGLPATSGRRRRSRRKSSSSSIGTIANAHKGLVSIWGGLFGPSKVKKTEEESDKRLEQKQSSATSTTTGDENDDDEEEYEEYDYQHHSHFQARASICSNNLWRIGPTRRCSVAQPVNYPTFYHRPITQATCTGSPLTGVSTISATGCCNHHHHHHHQSGDGSESGSSAREGAAVGALIQAAASNAAVRPKERPSLPAANLASQQQHNARLGLLRHPGNQVAFNVNPPGRNPGQPPSDRYLSAQVYGPAPQVNLSVATPPPPLPPIKMQMPDGGTRNHFQQATMNMPIFNGSHRHQLLQHTSGHLKSSSIKPQCVDLNGSIKMLNADSTQPYPTAFNQMQFLPTNMPRSRSTDHRLYAYEPTNQHCNLQAPQSFFASQQPDNFSQSFVPFGSNLLPDTQTIGRALGQVYMQKLQRQAAVNSLIQDPNNNNNLRPGRTMQRGNGRVGGTYLLNLNNNNEPSRLNLDSMRRSRSQTSLDHRFRTINRLDNIQSSCDQCSKVMSYQGQDSRQGCYSSSYHCQQLSPEGALPGVPGAHQHVQHANTNWRPAKVVQESSIYCKTGGTTNGRALHNNQQKQPISQLSLIRLINDVNKAIQNAMFIAQHIDNLDEFESVKENWKYIAMVIDRIFLFVFLFACIVGTVTIFAMAPWSYYTSVKPIDLQLTRLLSLNMTGDQAALSRSCQEF